MVALEPADLDGIIESTMQQYHIPGVSACIAKGGLVIWAKGYGCADIAEDIPVTPTTLFMLASISKTFTATALMQLAEAGKVDLDVDVNEYLPFTLINPRQPTDTMTCRYLLSHVSSIDDNWNVMYSTYVQGDTPYDLAYYGQQYFVAGGIFYDAILNFENRRSGNVWEYCNHNFVLLGYIVEAVTGRLFWEYCTDSVFEPLGMDETSWFLAGLDTSHVAMPYHWNGSDYEPLGQFGYADYPAGTLRTSAPQLARQLIAYMQSGRIDGHRILDSTTVDEMLTIQFPGASSGQGLAWYRSQYGGEYVWEHGGGDQGVSTFARFCPATGTGVAVLTNGESHPGTHRIRDGLFDFAATQTDPDFDSLYTWQDNCPDEYNPDQLDNDGDGVGNACCCTQMGNIDYSVDSLVTMGDLTVLIDHLFLSLSELACPADANLDLNPDGLVTMSDLTMMIDHLFVTLTPLPECPR